MHKEVYIKVLCLILAIAVFASTIFLGCSKSSDMIANPQVDNNLVSNGSFEINGVASMQGWSAISHDSSFVVSSSDVPPGGGHFSVRIKNEWTLAGAVTTLIPATEGTHRYQLSAWGKSSVVTYGGHGRMNIALQKPDTFIGPIWQGFPDTNWTPQTIIDTLTASRGDSIKIILQGDISQFGAGHIFFDLCRLERLD